MQVLAHLVKGNEWKFVNLTFDAPVTSPDNKKVELFTAREIVMLILIFISERCGDLMSNNIMTTQ